MIVLRRCWPKSHSWQGVNRAQRKLFFFQIYHNFTITNIAYINSEGLMLVLDSKFVYTLQPLVPIPSIVGRFLYSAPFHNTPL